MHFNIYIFNCNLLLLNFAITVYTKKLAINGVWQSIILVYYVFLIDRWDENFQVARYQLSIL